MKNKNKEISENFLWGGAVAAHQLEGGYDKGGKGISIADVMTAGANGVDRQITEGILPGTPDIKKTSGCLPRWALSAFVPPLHGPESFQMGMRRSRMRKGFSSMMISLTSLGSITLNRSLR